MLGVAGSFLMGLALVEALFAALASFMGLRRSNPRWAEAGRNAVYASAGILGLALVVLWAGFLGNSFQLRYVAEHSSRELPLYLKISALWAGQEGSLLLWAFLQALFTAIVVAYPNDRTRPLLPWASAFLSLAVAFFVAVTLLLSNPFTLATIVPANGSGLNPLLRHPGMVFHPLALYVGYVGLAVPCAFALAALASGQVADWVGAVRRWTLLSWLTLGLGLFLGMRWAYDVLGWGGYWGWDPVENAGLMPWLVATALLHGIAMQEQKGTFRAWNLFLAPFSFVMVLFGTFTTRSGMIQSVHAFARSNLGPFFLAFMAVTLVAAVVLIVRRRALLGSPASSEALLSREGAFFFTLVLLMTITASVFVGSLLPTLSEALAGNRLEAGPQWFDQVTGPQFAVLVLLMGVCPLLGGALSALRRLGRRGLPGLLGAVVLTVVAGIAGFGQPAALVGFFVIGLAGATTLAEYGRDVAALCRSAGIGVLQALWRLVGANRRRYGGYLVHMGIILMALGIVGTRLYTFEKELTLNSEQPAEVQGYTLIYHELRQEPVAGRTTAWASLDVYRENTYLATLQPRIDQYPGFEQQTVTVPGLYSELRQDLYVILAGADETGAAATFKVVINPLVIFLWLGGLVFLAGGTLALWPSVATREQAVLASKRRMVVSAIGLFVGTLVLGSTGLTMWANGAHGAASVRPRIGQDAPDFTVQLLDGSPLTLSGLRGQVVVVNIWGTWCAPCRDELPALQSFWNQNSGRGLKLVGVAFNDNEPAVRQAVDRYGMTYSVGLDADGRIGKAYGITAVPETFVLDRQGRVAHVYIGPVTAERLAQDLADQW